MSDLDTPQAANPQPETTAPSTAPSNSTLRDLIMTDARPNYRLAPGAAVALIRFLAAKQYVRPVDEAVAESWVEVTFEPGEMSREWLVGCSADAPPFRQAVLRFGKSARDLGYDAIPEARPFFLELRGTTATHIQSDVRDKICTILHMRPVHAERVHTALYELPEVPEDERPKDRRPRIASNAPVGTRVEEF